MTSYAKMLVVGPAHLAGGLLLATVFWPTPSRFGEWPEVEAVVTGTEGTARGSACRSVTRRYEYRRDGAVVAARGPHINSVELSGECDDRLPVSTRVIVAIDPDHPEEVRSRQDEADLRSDARFVVGLGGVFAVIGLVVTVIGFVRMRAEP